jgi:G3E family GTPase
MENEEKSTISELMIDQLEVANLVVLNKVDLATKEEVEKVIAYIRSISPNTEIVPTSYSKVDLKNILAVKRFDL